jgi:hypothetical protein
LLPCEVYRNNFAERATTIQELLTFVSKETAADLLKEKWISMSLLHERLLLPEEPGEPRYDTYIMDIPAILELCKQDVIPIVARNELYRVLSDMVPLFGRLKETNL